MIPQRTFRVPAQDVCYQKQVRDRYLCEGMLLVPHLDLKQAEVRRVSFRLAKQIILKYEWLGTMAATSYHYGLFFGSWCAGVCCLSSSSGANVHIAHHFGLAHAELAYLARGAMVHWAPPHANSKLIAWTCRLARYDTPAQLMLAYADPDAGEIGTVYQACNWCYIGQSSATTQWVAPNGRIFDQRYPWDQTRYRGGTRARWVQRLRQAGWEEQRSTPKYRYVYVFPTAHSSLRDRIERLRQPYPKRATSILADAPTVQAGESGAAPTVALYG